VTGRTSTVDMGQYEQLKKYLSGLLGLHLESINLVLSLLVKCCSFASGLFRCHYLSTRQAGVLSSALFLYFVVLCRYHEQK